MENPENRVLVDFSKIDYVDGVYTPMIGGNITKRYYVYFSGGNKLILFNERPIHEHEFSRYYPRELFVSTWNLVINKTK